MMELIDRAALRERCPIRIDNYDEVHGSREFVLGIETVFELIEAMPTIPAVPLESLCVWLAGYADPPKYAMKIIPKSGEYLINARAKAWEHHFRNMMECGLMEEGRHDTE